MQMIYDSVSWIWNSSKTQDIIYYPKKVFNALLKVEKPCETITKIVEVSPAGMVLIPKYTQWFVRIAGLSGVAAVGLGAYGAHVFYQRDLPHELKQVYETANRYHFIHTLALLGVPLCRKPKLAGSLLIAGTIIFCGTCYYYALTGAKNVRQFTPYGGTLLILGWLAMAL